MESSRVFAFFAVADDSFDIKFQIISSFILQLYDIKMLDLE